MKLTSRLQCIANKVREGSYPGDIGTDHAYIPIYLVKNMICSGVVATDVRKGPLERAGRNVQLYGLQESICLRRGYGLSPIDKGEVDCAVLAGMGGHLICDILDTDKEKAETIDYFIMQPVQAPEAVREFLYRNDYKIYDESLVKEGYKIYQVIAAEHGYESIDDNIYFEIGKRLIDKKDPLLYELIQKKKDEIHKVIDKICFVDSHNAELRLIECKARLEKYEEVLKCL